MAANTTARTTAPLNLPIDRIILRDRERPIDATKVANLRVSMRENGFIGAIDVRPVEVDDQTYYAVVIGAHRFTAWKAEGGLTIPAVVKALSDDEAKQIEIDENLIREDLTPLERAEFLARRFEVWSRRFPDRVQESDGVAAPKRGRPANSVNLTEFTGGAPETMGFATETAAQVGLSKSTIERASRVISGVPADLRRRLHGTHIARNDSMLRQLASIGDRAEQSAVVDVLLSGRTKNVAEARAYAAGNEPVKRGVTSTDDALKALQTAWKKAPPSVRAAFLDHLSGERLPKGWRVSHDG